MVAGCDADVEEMWCSGGVVETLWCEVLMWYCSIRVRGSVVECDSVYEESE